MLYIKAFKNYDEFRRMFVRELPNGSTIRKNGILLSFFKDVLSGRFGNDYAKSHKHQVFERTLDMASLEQFMFKYLEARAHEVIGDDYKFLNLIDYTFGHPTRWTDDQKGICLDGDANCVRYVVQKGDGSEKSYKMKAGKLFREILDYNINTANLSEQVKVYLCEVFTEKWKTHSMQNVPDVELVVDDDFERIYSSRYMMPEDTIMSNGPFGSCMTDEGYHSFYNDCVDASAASLVKTTEDGEKLIIARAVIFNEVTRVIDGAKFRLCERQYAQNGNDIYKHLLVNKLIEAGLIDGYKKIGAGCSDVKAFLLNDGTPLCCSLQIKCCIEPGSVVSYQDTFKAYDPARHLAYNKTRSYYVDLATTNGEVDFKYDDWHKRYCSSTVTVYYHGSEYQCDEYDLDEFRCIDGEYHHEDDCVQCGRCGEWCLNDDEYYSSITEEYYCCSHCLERAEDDYKEDHWEECPYCGEYVEECEYYSPLTDQWYCCADCRYVAEREYRNDHPDEFKDEDAA